MKLDEKIEKVSKIFEEFSKHVEISGIQETKDYLMFTYEGLDIIKLCTMREIQEFYDIGLEVVQVTSKQILCKIRGEKHEQL